MPLATTMAAFSTRDDWTAAILTWDDGVNPASNWSPTSAVADVVEAATELAAWIVATLSVSATVGWYYNSTGSGSFEVEVGGTFTVTANAAAQALLGWDASIGPSDTFGGSTIGAGVVATTAIELRRQWRDPAGAGDGHGSGSVMGTVPGLAAQRPAVALILNPAQAARLSSILPALASPRVVQLLVDDTWSDYVCGPMRRERLVTNVWRVSIEAVT
jgi:hypothetical protein